MPIIDKTAEPDIVKRLNTPANLTGDSTVAEAAATIAELLEALKSINIMTSPGNRTLDQLIRDMGYACDRARAAIAKATAANPESKPELPEFSRASHYG